MRWVVFPALVVFAFLAGRWTVPRPRQARAPRTSRAEFPPAQHREAVPSAPNDAESDEVSAPATPATPAARAGSDDAPGVDAPDASVEGTGVLEIHGHRRREGFNDFELLARDLRGHWTDVELGYPDDLGPLLVRLEPGPYRLRVRLDIEPGDRIYAIAIRRDERAIIDLAKPPGPEVYPLADGLGRVDVRVLDVADAPLAEVQVQLVARGDELATSTTPAGWVRFDVIPGTYTIRVGWLTRRVVVRAGRTQVVRIDGRAAAEIEVSGIMYAHTSVEPVERGDEDERWTSIGDERRMRHVLLKPGRYRLVCYVQPGRRHVIEEIALAAGDRVRRMPEQVGVFVRVTCPAENPYGRVFNLRVYLRDAAGQACQVVTDRATLFDSGEYTATAKNKAWISDPVSFRAVSGEMVVQVPVRKR